MKKIIKIGSRSSALAQIMAKEVKNALQISHNLPCDAVEIHNMLTQGDRILNQPLANIGGKGLFTAEIEEKLLNYKIDLAVHSTKDMPSLLPQGLKIAAYLARGAVQDCFVSHRNIKFKDLPQGALIGTSSLRRKALINKLRPDINVTLLRGNIETRLNKISSGQVDGSFLALCGLQRLGLTEYITEIMDIKDFPPPPCQGAICIESRNKDPEIADYLDKINHIATYIEVNAEREFLAKLDGSCRTPICAYGKLHEDRFDFFGMILSTDGKKEFSYNSCVHFSSQHDMAQRAESASALAIEAAYKLRAMAGEEFFAQWI